LWSGGEPEKILLTALPRVAVGSICICVKKYLFKLRQILVYYLKKILFCGTFSKMSQVKMKVLWHKLLAETACTADVTCDPASTEMLTPKDFLQCFT